MGIDAAVEVKKEEPPPPTPPPPPSDPLLVSLEVERGRLLDAIGHSKALNTYVVCRLCPLLQADKDEAEAAVEAEAHRVADEEAEAAEAEGCPEVEAATKARRPGSVGCSQLGCGGPSPKKGMGFPSGHAQSMGVVVGYIAVAAPHRVSAIAASSVIAAAVMAQRVIVGCHSVWQAAAGGVIGLGLGAGGAALFAPPHAK